MDIRIEVENDSADLIPRAEALWHACMAAINPIPVDGLEPSFGATSGAASGVARMIPAERPGTHRLVLSEGLFALPPEHQELTMG